MMFAASGQSFCYLIITILLRYNEKPGYAHAKQVAEASISFFFLYYVFFGIGMQGVPWLYPTEINSLAMRTKGAAIGTATNWIFNFMGECPIPSSKLTQMKMTLTTNERNTVVEITPLGVQNLKWKFYIIWTLLNASFVPCMYFFYPETAGRTLEDIDHYYHTNPPLLVFRDKTVTMSKRPEEMKQREAEELRRNSSVNAVEARRGSRIRSVTVSAGGGSFGGMEEVEVEKVGKGAGLTNGVNGEEYGHKEDV